MGLVTSTTPSASNTIKLKVSKTFADNAASAINVSLFQFTGAIRIVALYDIVTTTLGNHTAPYYRVYDGSSGAEVTSSTLPPDSSSFPPGSILFKGGKTTTAAVGKSAANVNLSESATANTSTFNDLVVIAKTATTSEIRYVYSTSDSPTSGAKDFYIEIQPLSDDASIIAI